MWTKQKRRTNRSRLILPVLTVGVLCYFGYHIYHGEYGLYSRAVIDEHVALLKVERQKLEAQRLILEKKVALLRDGTIEKDMLDEYVRKNLNLSSPNELTIMTSKGDRAN